MDLNVVSIMPIRVRYEQRWQRLPPNISEDMLRGMAIAVSPPIMSQGTAGFFLVLIDGGIGLVWWDATHVVIDSPMATESATSSQSPGM